MARKLIRINKFGGGLSQFDRVSSTEGAFLRGTQLDYRTDPSSLSLNRDEVGTALPSTMNLARWLVPAGLTTPSLFALDSGGYIKRRMANGTWVDFSSHASSAGQGLGYWAGDDNLYFANYREIGRAGGLSSTVSYNPGWKTGHTDSDYRPMKSFRDLLAIGSSRWLSTWDGTTFTASKLIFPAGWRVRSLESWGEYLAIGCWRGHKVDADASGIIFFWDGISTTYNFFVETKGGVQAMKTVGSELYMLIGGHAELWKYNGSLSKVTNFPGVRIFGDSVDINPGAVIERDGMLAIGAANGASTASFATGIYSYGSNNPAIPETFNHEFTGNSSAAYDNTTANQIGALAYLNDIMFFSTYNPVNTTVPVVVEIDGNSPFVTTRGGRYESLIINDDEPHRIKKAMKFVANFSPITSGVTLEFIYRADGGAWTSIGTANTVGDVEYESTRDPLPFDFREVQLGVIFNQATADPQPKLYSLILEFESEVPL